MKKNIIILSLIVLLVITGCSLDSHGTLKINFGTEQGSRTITPESEKLKIASYVIHCSSGSQVKECSTSRNSYTLSLVEGKWNISAEGLNADGEVIASSNSVSVDIIKYKDCEITLQLNSITDGDGVFSFRLGIPKDATDIKTVNCSFKTTADGIADYTFSFDFLTEGEIVDEYAYFSKSITVPSGSYDMCVTTINSIGEEFGIPINESVHVYGGEESKFEHVWPMAYFPLIEAKINDGRGIYVVPNKNCIVELSSDCENAQLYYTLNGEVPNRNSIQYTGKISISKGTTMKVRAMKDGWSRGTTTSFTATSSGPAGGYIFYDCDADNTETDPNGPDNLISSDCGWRFLEAAPSDIGSYYFGFYVPSGSSKIVGTETAIGTGKSNSERLVECMDIDGKAYSSSLGTATAEYAAKKCLDYRYVGYDDWFLPSKDELNLMYKNLHKKGLGSFANSNYWSSSENDDYYACRQYFSDGKQDDVTYRGYDYHVRAVRAF